MTVQVLGEGRLTGLACARAKSEAAEWAGMLEYSIAEEARINATDWSPMLKRANVSMIAMEIGTAMGLSEGQVHRKLSAAKRIHDHAPLTWLAFGAGRVDAARVQIISDGIDQLKHEASVVRLDQRVVAYAASHTTSELRRWVRRFVARVEPDEHGERADDERNTQQRRADLLAAWLTTNEAGEPALNADIAVTISAEALAGVNDDPIVSADGDWVIPAAWISDLIATGNTLWHRIITDPAGHTLDHTYLGRFAPEVLATAIGFRDAVCQAPGCTRSAEQCDNDHRTPHPHGPTAGTNMWALCRRHHSQKGHQVLRWMLPSGREAPVERAIHSPPPDPVSWAEHHVARVLTTSR